MGRILLAAVFAYFGIRNLIWLVVHLHRGHYISAILAAVLAAVFCGAAYYAARPFASGRIGVLCAGGYVLAIGGRSLVWAWHSPPHRSAGRMSPAVSSAFGLFCVLLGAAVILSGWVATRPSRRLPRELAIEARSHLRGRPDPYLLASVVLRDGRRVGNLRITRSGYLAPQRTNYDFDARDAVALVPGVSQ